MYIVDWSVFLSFFCQFINSSPKFKQEIKKVRSSLVFSQFVTIGKRNMEISRKFNFQMFDFHFKSNLKKLKIELIFNYLSI